MPQTTKHQRALKLLENEQFQEAADLLREALAEEESSELWNDWATVQVALNKLEDARHGFDRALALDPGHTQCQMNLGVLLLTAGEVEAGLKLLRRSFPYLEHREQAALLPLMDNHQAGKRVLIVHEVLPRFDRSGSDSRLMQVIRGLRGQGHQVTYVARGGGDRELYETPLKELGITTYSVDTERLAALGHQFPRQTWDFDDVLRKGQFDVAILFHWFWTGMSITEHYLDEIRKASPKTSVVVLTDDRHGVREWRRYELSGLSSDRERALDYLVREMECYGAADLVATVTEDDRNGHLEMNADFKIELLPMTASARPNSAGYAARKDFVFLADFDNPASRDAIEWFCEEIWPRIRKRLPEAKLQVAGNQVPVEVAGRPGVVVLGFVKSIAETMAKFRVFVSPIRYGTGIKTKNLHAMSNGIPLVTTTIGAEGMNLTDQENALLADTAGEFANKAVELYSNPDLWQALAANGPQHIANEFSREKLDAQIAKVMERATTSPAKPYDPEHRFSMRLVEELYPEVLTVHPIESRCDTRMLAYVQVADQLMRLRRPAEALEQLRHIFGFVYQLGRSPLLAKILSMMESCYRDTGDLPTSEKCGNDARLCLPELNPAFMQKVEKQKKLKNAKSNRYVISVVVPTYNRKKQLARCLQALEAQTFPHSDFEVIVVDDGSTDDTRQFLANLKTSFHLSCLSQANRGVGAARKAGVENASGEYLLLINDDTIAQPDLLEQHMHKQRKHPEIGLAVLGTFAYERSARNRALTYFLATDPFMFPQANMVPDCCYGAPHFVTCNLSVRKDLVLAAGSFDPDLRVGEDSDLGMRMTKVGCPVVYYPAARSWHDHLDITMRSMVNRAKAYGRAYLKLLEKHPSIHLSQHGFEIRAPLTPADMGRINETLTSRRAQIEEMVRALAQYDALEFEPFFATRSGNSAASDVVMNLFRQAVPQVHWFYVFDGLYSAWSERENPLIGTAAKPQEMHV